MGNRRSIEIFHLTDNLTPGGTERILVDLVNGLWQQGVGVGVCVTRDDDQLADELNPDVPVVVLKRRYTWDMGPVLRFARQCQKEGIKLLHAHGRGSVRFGAMVKAVAGGKIDLLFHDHYGELLFDQSVPLLLRLISRYWVDLYLAVDPNLQQWAIKRMGLPKEQTGVLANAIDLQRFETTDGYSKEELEVQKPLLGIMVANLRPQKDHLLLLDAFAQSQIAKEKLHVLFVGLELHDEYQQICLERVRTLGLQDQVTFLGKRLDIPRLLRSADVGLLSSRSESGPVVLLEYAAAGLPFVATLTGQVAHFFAQHQWPFLVSPGDVKAYAQALDQLVTLPPTQRHELCQWNKGLVEQLFGVGRQVDQLLGFYRQLGLATPPSKVHEVWA